MDPCVVCMGTETLNGNYAKMLVRELLSLHDGLLILLYVGCFPIMLTTIPNIETCFSNSVFSAHLHGVLNFFALRHGTRGGLFQSKPESGTT